MDVLFLLLHALVRKIIKEIRENHHEVKRRNAGLCYVTGNGLLSHVHKGLLSFSNKNKSGVVAKKMR